MLAYNFLGNHGGHMSSPNKTDADPIQAKTPKALPIGHRILFKIGLPVRHPAETSFGANMMAFGIPFGLLWATAMIFLADNSWQSVVPVAFLTAIGFGAAMAVYYRNQH